MVGNFDLVWLLAIITVARGVHFVVSDRCDELALLVKACLRGQRILSVWRRHGLTVLVLVEGPFLVLLGRFVGMRTVVIVTIRTDGHGAFGRSRDLE